MVLVVLGVIWIVILVPPVIRARAENVSRDSIRDFSFKIGALGRANAPFRPMPFGPRASRAAVPPQYNQTSMPMPVSIAGRAPAGAAPISDRAAIRRRQVVSVLGLSSMVSLMLALSGTPGAWLMFAITGVMFVAYLGLLAYLRPALRAPIEMRLAQVRSFPATSTRHAPAPEYAYRRTVNS